MAWSRIKLGRLGGGDEKARHGMTWPHVWLTTSAFACIGCRRRSSLVYDSGNVHNFFAPLHSRVPKLGTIPAPSSVPISDSPSVRPRRGKRVRNLATFQPHPRPKPPPQSPPPSEPPRHSRDHTDRQCERAWAESLTCGWK